VQVQIRLPADSKCRIIHVAHQAMSTEALSARRPREEYLNKEEVAVKETWSKPQVTEQEVGLEVTSYVAAEIKDS
jgi:coenzyme PQQ precursor peptide PqqA